MIEMNEILTYNFGIKCPTIGCSPTQLAYRFDGHFFRKKINFFSTILIKYKNDDFKPKNQKIQKFLMAEMNKILTTGTFGANAQR